MNAASRLMKFDSVQKLSFIGTVVAAMSWAGVAPRTLGRELYRNQFKRNLELAAFTAVLPLFTFAMTFDSSAANINDLISTFYSAFVFVFPAVFALEIAAATLCRLLTFVVWEPSIFSLTPRIPTIVLPWVLREQGYHPKRITLFVADFFTSVVACPIIEEAGKLVLVNLCLSLPRNFAEGKKGRRVKVRASRTRGTRQVTNINPYVVSMLVASWGIKFADSLRRVLLYSKPSSLHPGWYAFARGCFPVQELCGTLTALQWARRDVLGVEMGLVGLLGPAVFIHGMANFRGMKPVFKWNSAKPWSEMQLPVPDAAAGVIEEGAMNAKGLNKGFAKLIWLTILLRVTGYCVKNYYMINRQARKRTQRNEDAFAAELSMGKMLKKDKKDKKKD
ncbi:hypothetical protein TrCOL_g5266 [Triparma columacea]|uniref:Uncharacterized protein n=1 Tax=Triparma columacea TaxID=722753 RepID=A0A9W7GF44_9STRA|nr:hypothetical protein TrCOL_g5266 [Triparma columacea]